MGDLIQSPGQSTLPWEAPVLACQRCMGSKTVYRARLRSKVAVIGGKRIPCPECAGIGFVGLRLERGPNAAVISIVPKNQIPMISWASLVRG